MTKPSRGTRKAALLAYVAANYTGPYVRIAIGNEMWGDSPQIYYTLLELAAVYGFASRANYMGYRFHALANLCRTAFGASFGTTVKIVYEWQVVGYLSEMSTALAYMKTTYGNPSADVQVLANAPYIALTAAYGAGANALATTDSIAQIQTKVTAQGALQPASAGNYSGETLSVLARYYGMSTATYEDGADSGSITTAYTNYGAAIMDPGWTGTIKSHLNALNNAGYDSDTHFEIGYAQDSGVLSPEDELSNNPDVTVVSPLLAALQSYPAGWPTPTRNALLASGTTNISGANYCNNLNPTLYGNFAFASGLYAPYNNSAGYCPYNIWSPAAQSYTLAVSFSSVSGTPVTDLTVNGTVVSTATLVNATSPVALGTISLNRGWNAVVLGHSGVQSAVVSNLAFTPSGVATQISAGFTASSAVGAVTANQTPIGYNTDASGDGLYVTTLFASSAAPVSPTIIDNYGNSANFVQIGSTLNTTDGIYFSRYYCQNAAGGPSHQVTAGWATAPTGTSYVTFTQIQNGSLAALYTGQSNDTVFTGTANNPLNSGAVTVAPPSSGVLMIAALSYPAPSGYAPTESSGFTLPVSSTTSRNGFTQVGTLVRTTNGTYSANWSDSLAPGHTFIATIDAFAG